MPRPESAPPTMRRAGSWLVMRVLSFPIDGPEQISHSTRGQAKNARRLTTSQPRNADFPVGSSGRRSARHSPVGKPALQPCGSPSQKPLKLAVNLDRAAARPTTAIPTRASMRRSVETPLRFRVPNARRFLEVKALCEPSVGNADLPVGSSGRRSARHSPVGKPALRPLPGCSSPKISL